MSYTVVEFRQTPNPDALKCMVEPAVPALTQAVAAVDGVKRPRAYRSVDEAQGDPLAMVLFAVQGVTSVLIHEQWITVNKDKDIAWSALKPQIQKALREAP